MPDELNYQRMLDEVKGELQHLQTVKENLDSKLADVNCRIEAMTKTYNALAPLLGAPFIANVTDESIFPDIEMLKAAGITVAVRSTLDSIPPSEPAITAAQMRDMMAHRGWDWGSYSNPLATVYNLLRRLVAAGFAEHGLPSDGTKTFRSTRGSRTEIGYGRRFYGEPVPPIPPKSGATKIEAQPLTLPPQRGLEVKKK
jgi:hypothetical protein